MRKLLVISIVMCVVVLAVSADKAPKSKDKDMMRKMIIYDKKNPDVFYCPTSTSKHHSSLDKMIVKAVSIKKLCEYEGQPIPKDAKRDCWNDVDETDFACKEKYRIMLRKYPSEFKAGQRLQRVIKHEDEMISEMVKKHKQN